MRLNEDVMYHATVAIDNRTYTNYLLSHTYSMMALAKALDENDRETACDEFNRACHVERVLWHAGYTEDSVRLQGISGALLEKGERLGLL